ncbi:MAG: NADH-quinone oxidoreductase subunit N [Gemmatimonadales bacterium]
MASFDRMTPLDLADPASMAAALAPELFLTGASLVVLLFIAWRHKTHADTRWAGWLTLASLVIAGAILAGMAVSGASALGLPQMISLDAYRWAGGALVLVAAIATVLLSIGYLEREGIVAPEYYVLIILAVVGMLCMTGAADLIVLFLGLEIMSVSVYVLAGYDRQSAFSAEAALKYFLLGAFGSAFLLYGIALLYGATGSTNLQIVGSQLAGARLSVMAALGLALLLIGLLFKVAAAPFHMWAPDVYEGAPTPITTFMATGVKAAAFIALMRVLMQSFPEAVGAWSVPIGVLAGITMILGNLVALSQRSLKRMLAYSSVAHAGYILIGVRPGTPYGASAVWLYLAAYTLTTIITFGVLQALGRSGERDVTLDRIAGLAEERPGLAFAMTVGMLSLMGFPGTFGFIGKWSLLNASIADGERILAVILVLTSVVSAGYYLPVIMSMYMRKSPGPGTYADARLGRPATLAVAVATVVVLLLGIWPKQVISYADQTSNELRTMFIQQGY